MLDGFVIPAEIGVGTHDRSARIRQIICLFVYTKGSVHLDIRTVATNHAQSNVQRHSFSLDEVGSLEFKQWFGGGRIVLRPIHLAALDAIPGAGHGEVVLKVRRSDRTQAAALVARVRRDLSESRM